MYQTKSNDRASLKNATCRGHNGSVARYNTQLLRPESQAIVLFLIGNEKSTLPSNLRFHPRQLLSAGLMNRVVGLNFAPKKPHLHSPEYAFLLALS